VAKGKLSQRAFRTLPKPQIIRLLFHSGKFVRSRQILGFQTAETEKSHSLACTASAEARRNRQGASPPQISLPRRSNRISVASAKVSGYLADSSSLTKGRRTSSPVMNLAPSTLGPGARRIQNSAKPSTFCGCEMDMVRIPVSCVRRCSTR
jgi:hypothetical protein